MLNTTPMTYFTGSVLGALGVEPPEGAEPAGPMLAGLLASRGVGRAERALIYNPDACGQWPYQTRPSWFLPVLRHTQLALPVRTMLPSVTPVCFGTMYTGVTPAVHGIERYEKHPIGRPTLFDRLAEAGRSCALVAVRDSSLDILFSECDVDRYILPYDDEVNDRAVELIEAGEHDVVVVYNQEYDDRMHYTYPESQMALAALRHHIAAFDRLCSAARASWAGHDTLLCWATDHGTHVADMGNGAHGSDREDDLNVMHFFGAFPGREAGGRD